MEVVKAVSPLVILPGVFSVLGGAAPSSSGAMSPSTELLDSIAWGPLLTMLELAFTIAKKPWFIIASEDSPLVEASAFFNKALSSFSASPLSPSLSLSILELSEQDSGVPSLLGKVSRESRH
ncbi:hypothetical protein HWI79_2058 [Cryptosporidium felis]|nr:hypothetical protein HWI79_2058 [Cryptosporidium felis]